MTNPVDLRVNYKAMYRTPPDIYKVFSKSDIAIDILLGQKKWCCLKKCVYSIVVIFKT